MKLICLLDVNVENEVDLEELLNAGPLLLSSCSSCKVIMAGFNDSEKSTCFMMLAKIRKFFLQRTCQESYN